MKTARGMVREITVSGDRQHGKSDMLLMAAARDARRGKKVIYECRGWRLASNVQRSLLDVLLQEEVLKSTFSNGNLRVALRDLGLGPDWPGGGLVVFSSNGTGRPFYGEPDTYILDDTDRPTLEVLSHFPTVTSIYRSHCTGEDGW